MHSRPSRGKVFEGHQGGLNGKDGPSVVAPKWDSSGSSWRVAVGGTLVEVTRPRPEVVAAIADRESLARGQSSAERAMAEKVAPLGNNADFVPIEADVHSVLPPPATVKAFYMRSVGRDLLKSQGIDRRMRWCGSRIARGADGIRVYSRPDRAYGRVGGVCVCGQSICCPVCAPRIAAFRSAEVADAYQRALNAEWIVSLETFTKPHRLDMRPNALARELVSFAALWRVYQHHACRRESGAMGHHLAREINWGDKNGWHYHHHRLRYDLPGTFNPELAKKQWLAALESKGLRSEGTEEHAYVFGAVGTVAGARYVAKMASSVEAQGRAIGSEIASSATKGRNMNSLLADHARGDLQAGPIWVNGVSCVTATKVSSVRWSRGLRDALGMDEGKTDEQIAEEERLKSDEYLGGLNPTQWQGILKLRAEFALCCSANQGREAVNSFLAGLELGQLDDEDPRRSWRRADKTEA